VLLPKSQDLTIQVQHPRYRPRWERIDYGVSPMGAMSSGQSCGAGLSTGRAVDAKYG